MQDDQALRKTKVIWMIEHEPPPKPPCFDALDGWKQYLLSLHATGRTLTRRSDTGKYAGKRTVRMVFDRIDYCGDCDIGSATQRSKQLAGRCVMPASMLEPIRPKTTDIKGTREVLKIRDQRILELARLVPVKAAAKAVNTSWRTAYRVRARELKQTHWRETMLKLMTQLLQQLKSAVQSPQISFLPGKTGMAIAISWEADGKRHEVLQTFTGAEIDVATDEAIAAAIDALHGAVWAEVAKASGEEITTDDAVQRIKAAAAQASAEKAIEALVKESR